MPSPAEAGAPNYPRALPTLITLLDRYDPILFGLIYEEIEAKVVRDARGAYAVKQLEPLLKWLNGLSITGPDAGVMGLISGVYDFGAEGNVGHEEARKFLKPTLSRFEYHVHKVLCQLRCVRLPCLREKPR